MERQQQNHVVRDAGGVEDAPDEFPPEDTPHMPPSVHDAVTEGGHKRRPLPAALLCQQPDRAAPRAGHENRDLGAGDDCKDELSQPRSPGPPPRDLEVALNRSAIILHDSSSQRSRSSTSISTSISNSSGTTSNISIISFYYIDEVDRVPEAHSATFSANSNKRKSRIRRMGRVILRGLRRLAQPFVTCCHGCR